MKYKHHIFVCTNERLDGKPSCGAEKGMALVEEFKKLIIENDLKTEVRAQKAGCFDTCGFGPAVTIYPEGVFYGKVQLEDVAEIINSHIINNVHVTRLKMPFSS